MTQVRIGARATSLRERPLPPPPPIPALSAGLPPELTIVHGVETRGKMSYVYRMALGPEGVVYRDESPTPGVEAAAELARGDMCRIAALMLTARNRIVRAAEELEAEAGRLRDQASLREHQAQSKLADAQRARDTAAAAKRSASGLLSAIDAANKRVFGGKIVDASTLRPQDLVKADAPPTRDPYERQAVEQGKIALQCEAEAVKLRADGARQTATAAERMAKALTLREQAKRDGDALIMKQRNRAWTR